MTYSGKTLLLGFTKGKVFVNSQYRNCGFRPEEDFAAQLSIMTPSNSRDPLNIIFKTFCCSDEDTEVSCGLLKMTFMDFLCSR